MQEKRSGTLSSLPLPISVVLAKVQPLILDKSRGVREQLLKFLQFLPLGSVNGHANQFLLYIRAGMTHLAAEIRGSALDALRWLIAVTADEVVVCPGGWARTLRCFLVMLGWEAGNGVRGTTTAAKANSVSVSYGKVFGDPKSTVKQFSVLATFLEQGLGRNNNCDADNVDIAAMEFPLRHVSQHVISNRSDCFAHLNLFGSVRDNESQMYEDREDRQEFFKRCIWPSLSSGIENSKKEGGEIGRAAALLAKAVAENMSDFQEIDT